MTFELLNAVIAFVGIALGAIVAALKVPASWHDLQHKDRARRRAESAFAELLAQHTNDDNVKRYAAELGYSALVGGRKLTNLQRRCLIAMPDAESVISAFLKLTDWLTVDTNEQSIRWHPDWRSNSTRRLFAKSLLFVTYLIFCLAATGPAIWWWSVSDSKPMPGSVIALLTVTLLMFFPLAAFCFHLGAKCSWAARLLQELAPTEQAERTSF
jgi:hypothetical protein